MAGPANISFVTALDLGAVLPVDNTQSDINDAGVNFTVFYKFTCPAGLTMVWVWATSDNTSGYMPTTTPYDAAQVEILTESTDAPLNNNPIQFPVTAGAIHYIQVVKNVDSAGPEHVDLQIRAVPDTTAIPLGAIIITGDTNPQPCGVHSGNIDYDTVKFIQGIANGEGGDITPLGILMLENRVALDKYIAIYSGDSLTELGRDSTPLGFSSIRYNRTTGRFFVLIRENPGFSKLYRIPPVAPVVKTLVATLTGFGSADAIAVNAAETVAYFGQNTAVGQPVKRWNLSTDTVMADFVTAPGAGYLFTDVLVLEDDTVLVGWSSDTTTTGLVSIRHYSAAGALLHTYDFDSWELGNYGIARLAYALDSPLSFWVKLRERDATDTFATGDAIFNNVQISDGSVLSSIHHLEYNERNYIGPAAASYRGESGIWNSCPLIIYPLGAEQPPGLYKIVTNKRNDVDLAIPSPTFKTALMP